MFNHRFIRIGHVGMCHAGPLGVATPAVHCIPQLHTGAVGGFATTRGFFVVAMLRGPRQLDRRVEAS
jgi:hypothetical protein